MTYDDDTANGSRPGYLSLANCAAKPLVYQQLPLTLLLLLRKLDFSTLQLVLPQ